MTTIFVMKRKGKERIVADRIDRKMYRKTRAGFYGATDYVKYKKQECVVFIHEVRGVMRHVIYPWGGAI